MFPRYLFVIVGFALVTIVLVTYRGGPFEYYDAAGLGSHNALESADHGGSDVGSRMERFDLSRQECGELFPRLFDEIDIAKARGRVGEVPRKDGVHGFLRARIHNGSLYIINRGEDVWHRQFATLSSIYRALITAPRGEIIPNIEFTFCLNDHPQPNIWSLSRSEDPEEVNNTWLMPDYGYWSWPEPHIGSMSEARAHITAEDSKLSWADKIDKAVWRGTVQWAPNLRGKLLRVGRDKSWADIQELKWGKNDLSMEEFCKWRFLIYTEGVTYSGRLKYQQLCRSVVISPPIKWKTFLSPMMMDNGELQNSVTVREDWSDLEEKIEWLRANPKEAERIADNAVKIFRERYMANGVETCYWRELFRAWDEVTDTVGEPESKELGVRWESFMLMGSLDWTKQA